MKLIKILFIIAVTSLSCNIKKEEIPGIYIAKNQINNIDTLRISKDGKYDKKVYRKTDNNLIYHNTGEWAYEEGRITFQDFFYDEDKIYSKEFDSFKDILITSSFIVNKKSGKVVIEYLEDKGFYRYEKQELKQ